MAITIYCKCIHANKILSILYICLLYPTNILYISSLRGLFIFVYICMKFYLFSKKVMYIVKKRLTIPKMVNRRTDSTMATIRRTNDDLQHTTQKRKFERHEPQKNQDWTRMPLKGKQFLLNWWHPSGYL